MVALDNDSLVGLGEHSSVQGSFDHGFSAQADLSEGWPRSRSLLSEGGPGSRSLYSKLGDGQPTRTEWQHIGEDVMYKVGAFP